VDGHRFARSSWNQRIVATPRPRLPGVDRVQDYDEHEPAVIPCVPTECRPTRGAGSR
jgi:hypothetical protein